MVICLFSSPQSFSCSSLPFLRFCFLFILLCVMTTVSRDGLSSSVYSWRMNGIQLRQSENIGRFVFRLCCVWSYWAIQDIGRHGRPLAGWFVEGIRRRVDHAENHHLIHAANDVAISESGWEHTQSFRWLTDKLGFDRLSHRLFGQSNYLNALIEICENGQKWIIFRCITLSSLPLVWSFVRGAVLPAIHTNMRRCTHSLTANFIR